MKLSLGEHLEWLQFRRVKRGGVARDHNGDLLDSGHPLPSFVAQTITALIEEGLLEVGQPCPQGLAQVRHTDTGRAHYSHLCRRQHHKTLTPQTPTDH